MSKKDHIEERHLALEEKRIRLEIDKPVLKRAERRSIAQEFLTIVELMRSMLNKMTYVSLYIFFRIS